MAWGRMFKSVYTGVLAKICLIFLCIVGAPRLCIPQHQEKEHAAKQRLKIKVGASCLSRTLLSSLLPDHSTSFTAVLLTNVPDCKRTLETLRQEGVQVTSVLIPDGIADEHMPSTSSKLPMHLCKQVGDSFIFPSLATVRVLFIDLFTHNATYPYHALLLSVLRHAAQQAVMVVVLDRPTHEPRCIEGVVLHDDLSQELTIPTSLYRGMTMGELARYLNTHVLAYGPQLRVVPFQAVHGSTKSAWHSLMHEQPPAPALRRFYEAVAQVNPFVAGIQSPTTGIWFALPEKIGVAPEVWEHIAEILAKHGGVVSSYKGFHATSGHYCHGLSVDQAAESQFHSLAALIEVLEVFKAIGLAYTFSSSFDSCAGTDQVRTCIENGRAHEELLGKINTNLEHFYVKARDAFMYLPFPCLAKV